MADRDVKIDIRARDYATKQFNAVVDHVVAFNRRMQQAAERTAAAQTAAAQRAADAQRTAAERAAAAQAKAAEEAAARVTRANEAMMARSNQVFMQTRTPIERLRIDLSRLANEYVRGTHTYETYRRAVRGVTEEYNRQTAAAERNARSVRGAAMSGMARGGMGMGVMGAGRGLLMGMAPGLAGAGAAIGTGMAVGYGVRMAADAEMAQTAFAVMLRDSQKAKQLLGEIDEFAAKTPFQSPELRDMTKQLVAYGFASEEVMDITKRLGELSAGLGINLGELAYLYGTTRTQGRLYTRDLNQFVGRGIPLAAELAKQFNVTEAEVRSLVESGVVGFAEVDKAIRAMTSSGGQFGGMMDKQSLTLSGRWSTVKDNIGLAARELANNFVPAMKSALDAANEVAESIRDIASGGSARSGAIGDKISMRNSRGIAGLSRDEGILAMRQARNDLAALGQEENKLLNASTGWGPFLMNAWFGRNPRQPGLDLNRQQQRRAQSQIAAFEAQRSGPPTMMGDLPKEFWDEAEKRQKLLVNQGRGDFIGGLIGDAVRAKPVSNALRAVGRAGIGIEGAIGWRLRAAAAAAEDGFNERSPRPDLSAVESRFLTRGRGMSPEVEEAKKGNKLNEAQLKAMNEVKGGLDKLFNLINRGDVLMVEDLN